MNIQQTQAAGLTTLFNEADFRNVFALTPKAIVKRTDVQKSGHVEIVHEVLKDGRLAVRSMMVKQ